MHSKDFFLLNNEENKKQNILFLDIDGVIQPYHNQERFNHDMDKTVEFLCKKYNTDIYKTMDKYDVCAAFYDWDDSAIGFIKKLVYEYSFKIVFSTGWREYNNLEQLKALFLLYDLDEFCIDNIEKGSKVRCINEYLTKHIKDINKYIIIDDQDFTLEFGHHFLLSGDYFKESDYNMAKFLTNNFNFSDEEDGFKIIFGEKEYLGFFGKIEDVGTLKIFKGYFYGSISNFNNLNYAVLLKHVQQNLYNKCDGITINISEEINDVLEKENIGYTLDVENLYDDICNYKKFVNTNYKLNHWQIYEKYKNDLFLE